MAEPTTTTSNPPGEETPKQKDTEQAKDDELVSEIVEQRKASCRYLNNNFYAEFAEIYRNIHARTTKLHRKNNRTGELEEDKDRTNVCVPDHFVMLRRGTARLTRNPPNLRVRGGPDDAKGQQNRDKTSAQLMYQWDRGEAQRAFKRVVSVSYGLGWGVGKVYYDEVPIVRRLRRLTSTLEPKDFDDLADSTDPQIADIVKRLGPRIKDPTPFKPDEMALIVQEMGDQTSLNKSTIKYRGPVLDAPFVGDIFPEAGFPSLSQSGYVIENSVRDEDWCKYWLKQTSINPKTGQSAPVFDEKAVQECLDEAGSRTYVDEKEMSLRRLMREEIEIADPSTSGKPKPARKKIMVDERHSIAEGHLCIDFVGEEKKYLGRLWYPWDTYGKYTYCEMVLIPDWLGGIGMSTLRVTRFLMMLRNVRENQTTDFINNKLLPLMKVRDGADITAYDVVRTGFARIWKVESMADAEFQQDPTFPAEAWQDQAQYKQDMQQVDPSTVDYAPGTADSPGPGKFATTAKLADKAADSVTADTLDQVGMFIRDVVELELAMNQQAQNEPDKVPKEYFERIDAESIKTEGAQARVIEVDPMDIQEIYEILPEQGSTLAADDEFRVSGLQNFIAIGERHPDIVNLRAAITALARATPGINAEDIILPPPPPTPPQPPVKFNISLAIKWGDLAPDVQSAILQKEGLPEEVTHVLGVSRMLKETSEAADAASNLEAPVDHTPQAPEPVKPGKPKPNGAKK